MAVTHKSAIAVKLLHIPVGLYKTITNTSIAFNQLCKDSHEKIKYKKYCLSCDKEVNNNDIIKGYKYKKERYTTFSADELKRIK